MEHRRRKRHRTFALVKIQSYREQHSTGLVYNINRYGAYILTTSAPKIDRMVDICLPAHTGDRTATPISGIVVHRNDNGFGIMFCHQETETWQLVSKLSSYYTQITRN